MRYLRVPGGFHASFLALMDAEILVELKILVIIPNPLSYEKNSKDQQGSVKNRKLLEILVLANLVVAACENKGDEKTKSRPPRVFCP